MAKNSLFAILLRSPWWISFVIAIAIVAACSALLPKEIWPFAALGAVPIFIIGCMAAWRQLKAPSGAKVEAIRAEAAAMSWKQFSTALEAAWKNEGQNVQHIADRVVDLRLEKSGTITLVSARRWKAATHGVESLKELDDAVTRLKAQYGVYVVLQGSLSDTARAYATEHGLLLLEGDALAAMLLKSKPRNT
ncbi:restriction endonuclease [Diaphorobacter sp. HDW4A]|nr:restriction endonuclease [Diaphorobacter sp. HDW4A]QIL84171.1 restriction endonuclease [Diaphorobacter sp. HDW4A]